MEGINPDAEDSIDPKKYGKTAEELATAKAKTKGVTKMLNDEAAKEIFDGYKVEDFWLTSDKNVFFSEDEAKEYTEQHFAELTYEHYTLAA